MNCPNCSAPTKTFNSRQQGTRRWRRHECANGHRFTTWEIHESELPREGEEVDLFLGAAVEKILEEVRVELRTWIKDRLKPLNLKA